MKWMSTGAIGLAAMATATPALAQLAQAAPPVDTTVIFGDSGDTAWVLASSALVLLMTLPGLALFYGGLVRTRNALSVPVQCLAIAAITSLIWIVLGYSLAFSDGTGLNLVGGLDNWMLNGMGTVREGTTIPETAFALFQMTFAIITPALIVGALVERVRFSWLMLWTALWSLLVYAPVAHWVWGNGWLAELGALDFAGGIVVHTTAGVSAIVVALLVGKRRGFPKTPMMPHAPVLTLAGAGLLWVGWFGFNGGSALGASDDAASAILATHVAASAAAITWMLLERFLLGKPTAIGLATGAVAGLATITPAAGFVGVGAALIIGVLGAAAGYFAIRLLRVRLQIDDSLDVFAVHGVGGILGSLLLAVFLGTAVGGTGYADGVGLVGQLGVQALAVVVVAIWSAIVSLVLALGLALVLPMRVTDEQEHEGLDIASHGERGWDFD